MSDVLSRSGPAPDAVVAYGPLPDQLADVYLPTQDSPRPLVMLIHGGFWRPAYDRLHVRSAAAALRDEGWPVASPEYRRVPGQPGASTDDVRRALGRLPGLVADLADGGRPPVVLLGHSAGGQLALWAASVRPPEGLSGTVGLAPVADLVLADRDGLSDGAVAEFVGGAPLAWPDLDPVRLPDPDTPVMLVHGTDDEDVPLTQSRSYLEVHPAAVLDEVPGAGHLDLIDPLAPAFGHVVAALEGLSRSDPTAGAGFTAPC